MKYSGPSEYLEDYSIQSSTFFLPPSFKIEVGSSSVNILKESDTSFKRKPIRLIIHTKSDSEDLVIIKHKMVNKYKKLIENTTVPVNYRVNMFMEE
jgi:hypothetical protein